MVINLFWVIGGDAPTNKKKLYFKMSKNSKQKFRAYIKTFYDGIQFFFHETLYMNIKCFDVHSIFFLTF